MKQNIRIIIISSLLLILSVSISLAASVTIVPSGGTSYAVLGGSMDGVAGIDLSVSYDSASLASPSVNQGALVSGSMFLANANIPGNIKIAIITTTAFKGSGQIATITFGSQTGSGGITGVTASMINISGGSIPVQAAVAPSGSTPAPVAATEAAVAGTTAAAGTASAVTSPSTSAVTPSFSASLGTVSLSQETQQSSVAVAPAGTTVAPQSQMSSSPSAGTPEQSAPAGEPATVVMAEPAPVQSAYIGIAERFKAYQGARIPATMISLFQKPVANTIRQEPLAAISDGKSSFKLFVDLVAGGGTSPNFALNGAKMVSLKSAGEPGKWIVEATPQKNALKVYVTILNGNTFVEYPVTVVPPIAVISGKEADFAEFLKDSGAKAPKFDLNADGRHDYQDDYIYTAHYLSMKSTGKK